MLNFVLGTAGSGKTTLLRRRICARVKAGGNAIVLVPEQYSFETERALYQELGARHALHVEVLSFTRLCNRIFREYGGLAGDYIDDSARLLLMNLALHELGDQLTVYTGKDRHAGFLQTLVAQMSEFKNAGIRPEQLDQFASRSKKDALTRKVKELSNIYRVYQAMIERSYKDAEDDLTRACGYLECEPFFSGSSVYIDSFKSFTAGEYQLLRLIFEQAPEVTVALCADTLEDNEHGLGLFSLVKKTAARLQRIAGECGMSAQVVAQLPEQPRYANAELKALEQGAFRLRPKPYVRPCPAVTLVEAANQYDEMEFVAAAIAQAVRGGMRYRDIAVVGRDLALYEQAIESVLERYEIPYFMDLRVDISSQPLVAGIFHAVEAVRRNFDTSELLALLKTTLLGVEAQAVGELENYCYIWDIRGAMWLEPFQWNPAGFGKAGEEEQRRLARVEALRAWLMGPLIRLKASFSGCDGLGFAKGVFVWLEESGALENLRRSDEKSPLAQSCAQLYDTVVDLLDQFATALKGSHLPLAQFSELLRLVFSSIEIGVLPQTLDQVILGSADRVRLSAPKLVLLIGANEGVFPAAYQQGGIFSDAERERMIQEGLEIANTAQNKALDEIFCAYTSLCAASQRVYVCYSRANLRGAALYPSALVKTVRTVLPLAQLQRTETISRMDYLHNEATLFDTFCSQARYDTPFTASLLEVLQQNKAYAERAQRLLHPAIPSEYRLYDKAVLQTLYQRHMTLSPSKIDRFYQCRLSYFCRYGLALLPRRRAQLSPLESGSLVHYVLQVLLQRHPNLGEISFEKARFAGEIKELLAAYIQQYMQGPECGTARFAYLLLRLEGTVLRLLEQLAREFAVSDFRPAYLELPIQRGAPLPSVEPFRLALQQGRSVEVEGCVDRVDLMRKNGRSYLRVIDYKTGSKDFSFTDVWNGMNLQMLLYLFTLQRMGKGDLSNAIPAGILYLPAATRFSLMERNAGPEEALRHQMDSFRMKGLLLDSIEALSGMEHGGGGLFIPVTLEEKKEKKAGASAAGLAPKGPVATLAEFGRLQQQVDRMVIRMAQELSEGNIQAMPTYTDQYYPCDYCDYRAVCGREAGDPRIDATPIKDKEDFFARLEEENRHG